MPSRVVLSGSTVCVMRRVGFVLQNIQSMTTLTFGLTVVRQ